MRDKLIKFKFSILFCKEAYPYADIQCTDVGNDLLSQYLLFCTTWIQSGELGLVNLPSAVSCTSWYIKHFVGNKKYLTAI